MGCLIEVKNARQEDIHKVVKLEEKIWPPGTRATKEKFESRIRFFPEGFFLAFKDANLIGASTSQIIHYNPNNHPTSWEEVTDNGFIEKTHTPHGNALYVVSIGAVSRSGGGSALLEAQKKLKNQLNLQFLVLGARIPGYDAYCREKGELEIEKYITLKRDDGELLDHELRFYTRNGLRLLKIVKNYMEDDKESRNFGAILYCE